MSFRSIRHQSCETLLLAATTSSAASAYKTISLQPISVSVGTGLNLNAGIGAINLHAGHPRAAIPAHSEHGVVT